MYIYIYVCVCCHLLCLFLLRLMTMTMAMLPRGWWCSKAARTPLSPPPPLCRLRGARWFTVTTEECKCKWHGTYMDLLDIYWSFGDIWWVSVEYHVYTVHACIHIDMYMYTYIYMCVCVSSSLPPASPPPASASASSALPSPSSSSVSP